MSHRMRTAIGITVAAVAMSGLVSAAPALATAEESVSVCRYYLGVERDIPVRSGPGKQYRVVDIIPDTREAPIFGTCVSPGRGPSHWVKVAKGQYRGAYVWRNYLDRM